MSDETIDDAGGGASVAGDGAVLAQDAAGANVAGTSEGVGVVTGEHDGQSEGVHGNGSLHGNGNTKPARIPALRGGTLTPIRSSERGLELVTRRWALYRAKAEAATTSAVAAVADTDDGAVIADALRRSKREAGGAAYGAIVGKLAERAYMDADPQSARFVRSALGADVGAPVRGGSEAGVGVGVDTQSVRDLAELLAAYRAWRDGRRAGGDNSNYNDQSAGDGDGSEGE